MDIRFVQSEEEAQLARNVITGFPSKTPEALLHNMAGELKKPEEGRYLGCFDDNGNLIGSSLLMDFEERKRKADGNGRYCLRFHQLPAQKGACGKESDSRGSGRLCKNGENRGSAAPI